MCGFDPRAVLFSANSEWRTYIIISVNNYTSYQSNCIRYHKYNHFDSAGTWIIYYRKFSNSYKYIGNISGN